jgi:hypothetical protein
MSEFDILEKNHSRLVDKRRKPFAKKTFARLCNVAEGTFLENLKRLEKLGEKDGT